jgi:hypothetical protein
VHAVHIPWRLVQASTLATINQELARYRTVFTTNYDLLNYWAIQHRRASTTCSAAPTPGFDLSATATAQTRLLYLHGGLHLVRNQDGTARKLMSTEGTLLGFAINNTIKTLDDVPLFVSEGRARTSSRPSAVRIICRSAMTSYWVMAKLVHLRPCLG